MKLSEMKLKLDYRFKTLIEGKVECQGITGPPMVFLEWEYYDSKQMFAFRYKDVETGVTKTDWYNDIDTIKFVHSLRRTDGVEIPNMYVSGSKDQYPTTLEKLEYGKMGRPYKKVKAAPKTMPVAIMEHEEEEIEDVWGVQINTGEGIEVDDLPAVEDVDEKLDDDDVDSPQENGSTLSLPIHRGFEGEDDDTEVEEDDEADASYVPGASGRVSQKANGKFVHVKSLVDVYVTKNYRLFEMLDGNRELNKSKIRRIKDDIGKGSNLLPYCPIIVVEKGNKLQVIDGQHRLEVAKELGDYVYYVIHKGLSLYNIAKMNSNTEKWKAKDFINCYRTGGNKNYDQLQQVMDVYGFPLSVALEMLSTGKFMKSGGNENLMKHFHEGKFVVKKYREAVELANTVQKFDAFPGWN